jgi:hypothetical protein
MKVLVIAPYAIHTPILKLIWKLHKIIWIRGSGNFIALQRRTADVRGKQGA